MMAIFKMIVITKAKFVMLGEAGERTSRTSRELRYARPTLSFTLYTFLLYYYVKMLVKISKLEYI
jgi:hypothetical protein